MTVVPSSPYTRLRLRGCMVCFCWSVCTRRLRPNDRNRLMCLSPLSSPPSCLLSFSLSSLCRGGSFSDGWSSQADPDPAWGDGEHVAVLLVLLKWALSLGPNRWLGQLAWRLDIRFDISDKERALHVFTENKSQSQSSGRGERSEGRAEREQRFFSFVLAAPSWV